jgi:hypothetical protein
MANAGPYNAGTIFTLNQDGTEHTDIHHFGSVNGSLPSGHFTSNHRGFIFGTMNSGGVNSTDRQKGALFKWNVLTKQYNQLFEFS